MPELRTPDPFHGVFMHQSTTTGVRLSRHPSAPVSLPDPQTGQALRIEKVELSGAICPMCRKRGDGGFVSFVADLRLVFACPHCYDLVWIEGA